MLNTLNIDPILFSIGPFQVRWYGIIFLLGFVLAYLFLQKKRKELNLSSKDVENYIFYLIIGVIVGSRIIHVIFWRPSYFIANPLDIFAIWKGGLAFHGGLIGSIMVSYWFAKNKHISFAKLADIMTLPAVFGLALGRIANFINGELWGTQTTVPWCFNINDICRHPAQLYGAVKRFSIFGMLLFLSSKKHKDGFIFWSFVGLMGAGRFILDFFREDPRFFYLSAGQYLSLLMVFAFICVYFKYYKTDI